jgi:segregation and condensation protein A
MSFNSDIQQSIEYTVTTPVYEGPLDLLLQLIERAELDITKLALAQVTDQYLAHMRNLPENTAGDVSFFLVIAAKLLQIKSEALLPRPPVREAGEEDPGEALARQLIAYKRYRQIANYLNDRENAGLRTYLRLASPPKIQTTLDLSEIGLSDLMLAAQTVLSQALSEQSSGPTEAKPRISIREKLSQITRILRYQKQVTFLTLVDKRSRIDILVTFLALLELIKRHLVRVQQESIFGDISLEATSVWDDAEEFELEFRE